MSRFTPLLLAPALMLSACGTYNGGVESVYQPIVERNDYALDVNSSTMRSLASSESLPEPSNPPPFSWPPSLGAKRAAVTNTTAQNNRIGHRRR